GSDIKTTITFKAPDGKIHEGWVIRRVRVKVNPTTQEKQVILTMGQADVSGIPREYRWIKEGKVDMVPGREGVPIQTYATIRQMKLANVKYGDLTGSRMSQITNKRTILEFAGLKKRFPNVADGDLIMKTHSGKYGSTNIEQSGGRVKAAKVKTEFASEKTAAEV